MYGGRDNGAKSDVRFHTLKQDKLYMERTFLFHRDKAEMNKTALKKEEKVLRMKNVARNKKKKKRKVPAYGKRSSKSCRKIVDRLSFQTRKKISTIEVFSLICPWDNFCCPTAKASFA